MLRALIVTPGLFFVIRIMKQSGGPRLLPIAFFVIVLAVAVTVVDGCSCAKRHPQEHYCSADFGNISAFFIRCND